MKMFLRFLISGILLLGSVSMVFADVFACSDIKGRVARALVTTAVQDREPVDRVLILENDTSRVYFFSDLRQMQGEQITHTWEHEGKVVMRKSFDVKGPRWRVYSIKDLQSSMVGHWTVLISNRDGCPLKAVVFQVVEKGSEGPAVLELD